MRHLPERLIRVAEVALARVGRRMLMRPLIRPPSSVRSPVAAAPRWSSVLIASLAIAAVVGDAVGYAIGWKAGPLIFQREQSFLFRRDHLLATNVFYEKHGGKTIVIARFVPIIRTFAPVVAGIGQMRYRRFASYNVFGGIGWVVSMCMAGFWMGKIPGVDKYLHLIIVLVIFLSVLPAVIEVAKTRLRRKRTECLCRQR